MAREFHAKQIEGWSPGYASKWLTYCERDLFPRIGRTPLGEVTPPKLLEVLRLVEARGVKVVAHDLRQYAGQVLRYGIQTGQCERNAAADLTGALQPVRKKSMADLLALLAGMEPGDMPADANMESAPPVGREIW